MADFDIAALFAALDARRRSLGLSWQQVAREINDAYKDVPCRPISTSTLTGMNKRKSLEGNCVLQFLIWLGRTPESFVPGHESPMNPAAALAEVGPALILRWDPPAIYAALDEQRVGRGLSWQEVARQVGTSPRSLTGLSKATHVAFPGVMRVVGWLERPAANFTAGVPF